MTEQADLFAPALPKWEPRTHARSDNLATSRAAAESMPESAASLCRRIFACLREHGAATQSEIAARLGLLDHCCNKRISDLKNAGLVHPSGVTRTGPSGRQQTVWIPTIDTSAGVSR
jgi:predicted ArsR family transcriptional regulator